MLPEPIVSVLLYSDMQSEVIEFDLRTVVFAKSYSVSKHLGPDQFAERFYCRRHLLVRFYDNSNAVGDFKSGIFAQVLDTVD